MLLPTYTPADNSTDITYYTGKLNFRYTCNLCLDFPVWILSAWKYTGVQKIGYTLTSDFFLLFFFSRINKISIFLI